MPDPIPQAASAASSRRVLLLTSSTGSGHDQRAAALAAWLARHDGPPIAVHTEHVIENGSRLGALGVGVYNTIQRWQPWLHHIYWHIVEAVMAGHGRRVALGGRYYRQVLAAWRPHCVVSLHDSTNRGYFEDAKRVLGPDVRCVTYCGEWSGGYGFSRNWLSPAADHFVARTADTLNWAVAHGRLAAGRGSVFTPLLAPHHFEQRLAPDARIALFFELGLHPGLPTVLLAAAGRGANHHLWFLDALLPLAGKIQVIVVCGQSAAALSAVRAWSIANSALAVRAEGYSRRMGALLQIATAVVTRGGSNTAAEALFHRCPPIFHHLGGQMPQESCTTRWFTNHRCGVVIPSPRALLPLVDGVTAIQRLSTMRDRLASALEGQPSISQVVEQIVGP
jgi:processive 1,2-diacylglycerol beta-glucosyltransferase